MLAVLAGTVSPPAGGLDFGPISSLVLLAPTPEEEPNASGLREAQVCLYTLVSRHLAQPLEIPQMQTGSWFWRWGSFG